MNTSSKNEYDSNYYENDEEEEETRQVEGGQIDETETKMSIMFHNGRLACCYYDSDKKCLFYLKDLQETEKFELVGLLIEDVRPRLVVTSDKCDLRFLNFLRARLEFDDAANDNRDFFNSQLTQQEAPLKRLKILTNRDFDYEAARERIFSLDTIIDMPANMRESEKIIYFAGLFDFECQLSVRCVGALLKLLGSAMNASHRLDFGPRSRHLSECLDLAEIFWVRPIQLDQLLLMDMQTFESLDIFNDVDYGCAFRQTYSAHSSAFRTRLNDKHGVYGSLYGLFLAKVRTRMGIGKLRSFMLKPTRDVRILRSRHLVLDFFVDMRNQAMLRFLLNSCLKSCKHVEPILKRMKTSKCSLADWKRILATTQAFIKIIHSSNVILERIKNKHRYSSTYTFMAQSTTPASLLRQTVDETEEESIKSGYETTDNLFSRILAKHYDRRFDYLLDRLVETIDFKKSIESKSIVVNGSISPRLQQKRDLFASLPELLTQLAEKEINTLNLTMGSMIYFPMLGFLVQIKNESILDSSFLEDENSSRVSEDTTTATPATTTTTQQREKTERSLETARGEFVKRNPSLRLSFYNDELSYFKSPTCDELDAEIGDISLEIADIETQLLDELQAEFVRHSHIYADMSDVCAELDCLLAFAQVAIENNYVRPSLILSASSNHATSASSHLAANDDEYASSFIRATDVRHPLVELNLDNPISFVSNSVQTGSYDNSAEDNKIKILTGPNASGKTIYVKQVGLLVYMSMIGSFVAAKEAELGDFDRIYTRLSSIECISLQMSSFSIDLKQLSDALNGATRRSLVLIDELGRGTELVDGQALVAATIRFLVSRRFPTASQSPHVYLITHFYDILHGGETLFGERISRLCYLSLENFVKGPNSSKEFMYRLQDGITVSSYAINSARRIGLPDSIVEKSNQVYKAIRKAVYSVHDEIGDDEEEHLAQESIPVSTNASVASTTNAAAQSTTTNSDVSNKTALIDLPDEYKRQRDIIKEALVLNYEHIKDGVQVDKEEKKRNLMELFKRRFNQL